MTGRGDKVVKEGQVHQSRQQVYNEEEEEEEERKKTEAKMRLLQLAVEEDKSSKKSGLSSHRLPSSVLEACLAATEVRRRSGALNSSSSKFLKSGADRKQQRVEEVSSAEQFTRHRREPEHSAAPGMVPCTPGAPGLSNYSPE